MSDAQNLMLRSWLNVLGWSPVRLARQLTMFAQARGVRVTVSDKAPYHWLNGARPRPPVPDLVAGLLSEQTGERITPADLGWLSPAVLPADHGLDDPWRPANGARVLDQAVRSDSDGERRRAYRALDGITLMAAVRCWLADDAGRRTTEQAGRRVDATVLNELDRLVDARRHLDDLLAGSCSLHGPLREDLRFVIDLLEPSDYATTAGSPLPPPPPLEIRPW